MIFEVTNVKTECTVLFEVEHLLDVVDVLGLSVWCQAHDLVLGRVHLEPEVCREGAVE